MADGKKSGISWLGIAVAAVGAVAAVAAVAGPLAAPLIGAAVALAGTAINDIIQGDNSSLGTYISNAFIGLIIGAVAGAKGSASIPLLAAAGFLLSRVANAKNKNPVTASIDLINPKFIGPPPLIDPNSIGPPSFTFIDTPPNSNESHNSNAGSNGGEESNKPTDPTTTTDDTDTSGQYSNINVYFKAGVNSSVVSQYSIKLLKQVLSEIELSSCLVTSTIRTPNEQATAMYNNCEKAGAQEQYRLYGATGDKVIDVYVAEIKKSPKPSSAEIINAMEKKIVEVGQSNISKHLRTEEEYKKINVMDIGYSSLGIKKGAFVTQIKKRTNVKVIDEPGNGCVHIEITVQK